MNHDSHSSLPVFAAVTRLDGTVEHVRVGDAVRRGDRFEVSFASLSIGAPPARTAVVEISDERPRRSFGFGGDDSLSGLEYLAERARRVLANPKAEKWHDEQRALLREIESELERKRGGSAEAR